MVGELLAPAGSMEAFKGAVAAGADAVYLAGQRFGARAYANNFTKEELGEALDYAHLFGKRIYLTANVLTRESELEETVAFVRSMYERGLDGVIVQDLGVLRRLHEACPGLPLHASTQMSSATKEAVHLLKELGAVRIVPARELSLEEIKLMKAEGIEIEAFIHGAMCYAYSGRCLFSSFLGGRSGNRGRCAGPCRLPYDVLSGGETTSQGGRGNRGDRKQSPADGRGRASDSYPLSMKDMYVLPILPELMDAGIDSFKIEGRMKSPEYAAGVTSVYRKYIDRYYEWDRKGRPQPWKVDPEDEDMLRHLYIRAELSGGYYHVRNGRSMVTIDKPGYAGTDDDLVKKIREQYLSKPLQLPADGEAAFIPGAPAQLTVWTKEGITASASGDIVQEALSRPLTAEQIEERLRKTGGSFFQFDNLSVSAGQDIFLPVSSLNALRRSALENLYAACREADAAERSARRQEASQASQNKAEGLGGEEQNLGSEERNDQGRNSEDRGAQKLWCAVTNAAQAKAVLAQKPDVLVLDYDALREESAETSDGTKRYLGFPQIFRDGSRRWMEQACESLKRGAFDGAFVRTVEELVFLREHGYTGSIVTDHSVYCWNSSSAKVIGRYADGSVVPLELAGPECAQLYEKISGEAILTVYGRAPMMISAGCVRKTSGQCKGSGDAFLQIRDRMGETFPVRCVCGRDRDLCHNVIFNSVPLSLHAALSDSAVRAADGLLVCFTDEAPALAGEIAAYYRNGMPGRDGSAEPGADRKPFPVEKYTTGHYRKGAL